MGKVDMLLERAIPQLEHHEHVLKPRPNFQCTHGLKGEWYIWVCSLSHAVQLVNPCSHRCMLKSNAMPVVFACSSGPPQHICVKNYVAEVRLLVLAKLVAVSKLLKMSL